MGVNKDVVVVGIALLTLSLTWISLFNSLDADFGNEVDDWPIFEEPGPLITSGHLGVANSKLLTAYTTFGDVENVIEDDQLLDGSVVKMAGVRPEWDRAVDDMLGENNRYVGPGWKRFIVLTSHGGKNNDLSNNVRVYEYAVTAKHFHHWKVTGTELDNTSIEKLGLQNLRGMKAVGDALYIASAHSSRSKIVITDKCTFHSKAAKTFSVDGLNHPYGLAFYKGNLFVTNQNSNKVVRYMIKDGLGARAHRFAHISHPRGLAFDEHGHLYVASTKKGLYVLNATTGEKLRRIDIEHPVGVAFDPVSGFIFVGSVDGKKSGIYGINPRLMKPSIKLVTVPPYDLSHPAGIAIIHSRLFAVAQDQRVVYAWDLRTGHFKGPVITDLPKRPEQVAFIRCYEPHNTTIN